MKIHPAEQYAADVRDGNTIVCEPVLLAVKRYYSDLETAPDRGFYLDRKAAERAIGFMHKLKHTKGEFSGKNFILEGWQQFIIWNIFGWKRADGSRRFREAYVEVARKNGKTTLLAGVGLYMLYADGEARAEVYSAATTRDQAKICFKDAVAMVKATGLNEKLATYKSSITHEASGSAMQPLSSDYGTLDGLNPSCGIIDEYHAHRDNGIYDVLTTGVGSRRQPLVFIITTAGNNQAGPCFAYRNNVLNVLKGVNEDDTLFAMIYTLDSEQEVNDPKMWVKANPCLGSALKVEYLEAQRLKARNQPENYVNIMIKNFNTWMRGNEVWIADDAWMQCEGTTDPLTLEGCDCYGGLDLASVSDINAFVLEFHENDRVQLLPFFWIPEDTLRAKVQKENISYDVWVRAGFVKVTPGNVADYEFIKADILRIRERYSILSIAYDRWNSSQMVIDLTNEGLTFTPFGQGFGSMSTPTKEFQRIVLTKELEHFANPVLRWMVANAVVVRDPADNIKIDKKKSTQKVDGVVASIMAHGEYMTNAANERDSDPYSERGLLD